DESEDIASGPVCGSARSNPHLPLGSDGEALLQIRRARAYQGEGCAKALAAEFLAKAPMA
ncbi:hypothetical protein AK812_SmicGene12981, partial [Symbiodinium microadriaticum]